MKAGPSTPGGSSITLGYLFYMVTLGAILAACLRPVAHSQWVTGQSLTLLIANGIGLGVFVGVLLGRFYFHSMLAVGLGVGLGLLVGSIAGALALIAATEFNQLALLAFGGGWLIVLFMSLVARFSGPLKPVE
ncbi:MAG: hypothetical protein KDA45_00585 [Planctomycetales bacterium]|nr:hypothetical protein [Planctomycetales bacterium]